METMRVIGRDLAQILVRWEECCGDGLSKITQKMKFWARKSPMEQKVSERWICSLCCGTRKLRSI